MTTTTTPALELAARMTAIADHLQRYPDLPNVTFDGRALNADVSLQIATWPFEGEPQEAAALLLWAKSFGTCTIELKVHGEPKNRKTTVDVLGSCGDYRIRVWDVDSGDLYRWVEIGNPTQITVEQLAEYVAAGTVEGLGAR